MAERGLSLVEILIAVALGSVLCLAASTLLIKAKRAYLQDEQLARLLENGHFALQLLQRELSMAGYYGEALPGEIKPAVAIGSNCYQALLDLSLAFSHYNNVSSSGRASNLEPLPKGCARPGAHQAGSDVIILRRVMDRPSFHGGEQLEPLKDQALYLRADQYGVQLERESENIGVHSSLWRFHPQLLFLRNYSRHPGDAIPSLCRIRLSPEAQKTAPVECLVEGIEQMQFEFAVDTDGDRHADQYVTTLAGESANRVLLVRIHLLVRTPLPLPGHRDSKRYTLGNVEFSAPGDGYFRRVLSASMLLRNSEVYRAW